MKTCSTIAYVCPSLSSDGHMHMINITGNETPEEIAKWESIGYYKAHVVAIEVADESTT